MIACQTVAEVIAGLRQTLGVLTTARLVLDSRHCETGDVFVACPGKTVDGRDYFADALASGAAAIVYQADLTVEQTQALGHAPALAVNELSALLGPLAHAWWEQPSSELTVIAVTGTNGKTTTANWLSAALNHLGLPCGVIGTLGVLDPKGRKQAGHLTTPDVVSVHESLALLRSRGASYVVLEASSIGLDQNRLDAVSIDVAVFTNLTQDHLDYHGDMEAYAQAKALLFARSHLNLALINLDDERAGQMRQAAHDCDVMTYGVQAKSADVVADQLVIGSEGMQFDLLGLGQPVTVKSDHVGAYNASNMLAVAGVLKHLRVSPENIVQALQNLPAVAGRLETVSPEMAAQEKSAVDISGCARVVVDYAHTPDALSRVLEVLRPLVAARQGRLWCVVGCGGDRDATKRPLMAQIAKKGADHVVLTSDNPRNEPAAKILDEMVAGLSDQHAVDVEPDRAVAILSTIWQAQAADVVLLAGKGHETWQDVQGNRTPFDDRQWAALAMLFKDNPPKVQTDSRALTSGSLFVALRGEKFDGHQFLAQAQAAGVLAALVEEQNSDVTLPQISVGDTRLALQKLATAWRRRFNLPVVAVTGSNGKTTTKEMSASIFCQWVGEEAVLSTQGNLNNDIGVPLTVLRMRQMHRCGVIELGMNHPGEIAVLSSIAQPTAGLVLNAQREHQEFMQSVEAVAQENAEVLKDLPHGGVALFPDSDQFTDFWADVANQGARQVTFGLSQSADVSAQAVHTDPLGSNFELTVEGKKCDVRLSVAGQHNVTNACAAAACATAVGVPLSDIVSGLEVFAAVKGRMQAHRISPKRLLIDDTYNANPDSVRAAIDVLSFLPAPRALVLGDMGEVGDDGPKMHAEVGAYAKQQAIDYLWTLGEATSHSIHAFGANGQRFEGVSQLCEQIKTIKPISILVKGSRFMAMERVVQALLDQATEVRHAS